MDLRAVVDTLRAAVDTVRLRVAVLRWEAATVLREGLLQGSVLLRVVVASVRPRAAATAAPVVR